MSAAASDVDDLDDAAAVAGAEPLPGEDCSDDPTPPTQSPLPPPTSASGGSSWGGGGSNDVDDDDVQGTHVRVLVRVRPLLEYEHAANHSSSLLQLAQAGGGTVPMTSVNGPGGVGARQLAVQSSSDVHRFSFDGVLAPQAAQTDVYEAGKVERMLHALLKGYHGTIFGQRSSTYVHICCNAVDN
jgi:hypothetical protein